MKNDHISFFRNLTFFLRMTHDLMNKTQLTILEYKLYFAQQIRSSKDVFMMSLFS